MFICYLHGSQLASASSHYRAEPQRDRPLKESAEDIISVLCLTLSRYAIYSYGKNVQSEFLSRNDAHFLKVCLTLKVLNLKLSV